MKKLFFIASVGLLFSCKRHCVCKMEIIENEEFAQYGYSDTTIIDTVISKTDNNTQSEFRKGCREARRFARKDDLEVVFTDSTGNEVIAISDEYFKYRCRGEY